MEIERLVVGQLQTNCYLASCPKTKEVVIIDPADEGDFISQKILDLNLKPKAILATHGHFDHVLAVMELKLNFRIPFLIHQDELFLLKRAKTTADYFSSFPADPVPVANHHFKEGEEITFGEEKLRVIETPGHTPGGVSFYTRGILFSGDTLFCQGVGRTDFAYASYEALRQSLRKLFKLPKETVVYPGHGSETNLAAESFILSTLA